jgi:hypothetical protein
MSAAGNRFIARFTNKSQDIGFRHTKKTGGKIAAGTKEPCEHYYGYFYM